MHFSKEQCQVHDQPSKDVFSNPAGKKRSQQLKHALDQALVTEVKPLISLSRGLRFTAFSDCYKQNHAKYNYNDMMELRADCQLAN